MAKHNADDCPARDWRSAVASSCRRCSDWAAPGPLSPCPAYPPHIPQGSAKVGLFSAAAGSLVASLPCGDIKPSLAPFAVNMCADPRGLPSTLIGPVYGMGAALAVSE
jgi:hypothetical protein